MKKQIKTLKEFLISAREILGKKFNHLKIFFFESKYKLKTRWLRIVSYLTVKARYLVRVFLLFLTFLTVLFVNHHIDFQCLNYSAVSNWLVAVGAMIVGILAIVFSLVNFLQQSVEDLQATMFYDKYIHGAKEKIVFILIAFSGILIIMFGVILSQDQVNTDFVRLSIIISIFCTGVVVVLLDYLHDLTSKKVNPKNAIAYLQKQSFRILDQIEDDANDLSKIIRLKNPGARKEETDAVALGYLHKINFNLFSDHVVDLLEISSSLASKNKISAGNRTIEAMEQIILRYLKMRNNNSIVKLSEYGFLAFESDSQEFLTKVLEAINRLTKYLLKNDQEAQLVKLVSLYEQIAIFSLSIRYTTKLPLGTNPIASQIVGYFKYFIEEVKKYNQLEVLFQASKALNNIGIQAVKSTDDIPLSTIIDQLQVLNIWSLTQNQSVVFDSTIQAWINILYALHYSPLNKFEQHADTIFEYIFTSINLTQNLKTRNIYFYSLISIFTDWLKSKLVIIFSMQLQRKYEHPEVLLKSLEELQRALRSYSDKSTSLNVNLFSVIGQFLIFVEEFIHRWIVKEQNTQVKEELKKQLLWFTHLPYWFMHNKTKIDLNDYEDLLDSSILVGLRSSVELADLELIENSASAINSMLKKIVAKENPTLGFDEPRAALKMVYLGIIALKKNYTQLFKQIKKYLLDTEKDYQAKHKEFLNKISGLHDIQFLIELWRWRDDFRNEKLNRKHSNFDPLRSLLIEHIEIEDIDRFIFAVWGACDDMCSLRKEHLMRIEIIEKQSAMRNIIRCLKLIALSKK